MRNAHQLKTHTKEKKLQKTKATTNKTTLRLWWLCIGRACVRPIELNWKFKIEFHALTHPISLSLFPPQYTRVHIELIDTLRIFFSILASFHLNLFVWFSVFISIFPINCQSSKIHCAIHLAKEKKLFIGFKNMHKNRWKREHEKFYTNDCKNIIFKCRQVENPQSKKEYWIILQIWETC